MPRCRVNESSPSSRPGAPAGRMDVLTRETAKPALPFAGVFQLVDFPLSNLAHSGITDVWLSVSFQGSSLEEQVANGRPWDLDRTTGGLRLLMPQEGTGSTDEEGFAKGNADELYRLRDQIRAADPAYVVVMSADHVYKFDFNEALATHREQGADCTVVTSEVSLEEASDHAVVQVDTRAWSPTSPTSPRSRRVRRSPRRSSSTGRAPDRDPRGAAPRARRRQRRGRLRPGRLRRPPAPAARGPDARGGAPDAGLLARPR